MNFLNVDLYNDAWRLVTLAVKSGGLGFRGVVALAPSAIIASAACTHAMRNAIHLAFSHQQDIAVDTSMQVSQCMRRTSQQAYILSHPESL